MSRDPYTGRANDIGPLFDQPRPMVSSIERDFRAFHAANPAVFETLKRLALHAVIVRKRRKLGIGALWEAMRWEMFLQVDPGDDDFKLNNNFRSRYARKLMNDVPALAGVFELRELKS